METTKRTTHDKEILILRSAQAKSANELDDAFVARCAEATGLGTDKVAEIVSQVRDAKTAKPVPTKPRRRMSAYDALLTEGHDTYDASDRYDARELAHPTDY